MDGDRAAENGGAVEGEVDDDGSVGETGLPCRVRRTAPIGLIEVAGTLRPGTVPRLRDVVLTVVAARPDAIVLDLEHLDDVQELSVSVFRSLGRTVAAAADGELILAAASRDIRRVLHRAAPLFVRVFTTCGQAMEAAARAPARRRVTRYVPADRYAGRTVRRVLDDVCTRWGLSQLRPAAQVIGTELVANAVEHVGAPVELCVAVRHEVLRIEVSDHSPTLPAPLPPNPGATGGYGLALLEGLASRWGARRTPWGRTVWAQLSAVAPRPSEAATGQDTGDTSRGGGLGCVSVTS